MQCRADLQCQHRCSTHAVTVATPGALELGNCHFDQGGDCNHHNHSHGDHLCRPWATCGTLSLKASTRHEERSCLKKSIIPTGLLGAAQGLRSYTWDTVMLLSEVLLVCLVSTVLKGAEARTHLLVTASSIIWHLEAVTAARSCMLAIQS
jgi:hypothetical protein